MRLRGSTPCPSGSWADDCSGGADQDPGRHHPIAHPAPGGPAHYRYGGIWHSHWVVLAPDSGCGEGALKVVDIPEGERPRLPAAWPSAPILIDSPGWQPLLGGETVEVRVPFADISVIEQASFDGVTAGLRINASAHAPLLCVVNVFDVVSGDLSLPGKTDK